MEKPNMARFKAMNMDEQVEMIEQSAQEALKDKEEIRTKKTAEAQRRRFLLLEGAQRIINQLQNDFDLIEMMRIPIDDPIKIQGEPSGLNSMQLEEITGSENPKAPPP
jgi:hypothetical protein